MMWEQAQGKSSKWSEYLCKRFYLQIPPLSFHPQSVILPDHFDTPMFWDKDDLDELQGTAVVGLSSNSHLMTQKC